jgi:hypothetical protein
MAKCSICNSRKGKRKCIVEESFICSLCCGQSRKIDKCIGCSFFKVSSQNKNYRKIPHFGTQQMSGSDDLQDIGNVIESILCSFNLELDSEFKDSTALNLLELAFDKYHFNDLELSFSDPITENLFGRMIKIIKEELSTVPKERFVKVMASIYRSIQRRTNGGKEYLTFIQQYVGARVGPGIRAIKY